MNCFFKTTHVCVDQAYESVGVWQSSKKRGEKADGKEETMLTCQCLTNLCFPPLSNQSYPEDEAAQMKKQGRERSAVKAGKKSVNSCSCRPHFALSRYPLPTQSLHFLLQAAEGAVSHWYLAVKSQTEKSGAARLFNVHSNELKYTYYAKFTLPITIICLQPVNKLCRN